MELGEALQQAALDVPLAEATRRSALELLDRPAVAVGVAEEGEPRSGRSLGAELLDLGDLHPAAGQLGADGVDVLDDELRPSQRSRLAERHADAEDDRG